MTTRKRGQYPAALFWNTPAGDLQPDSRDNPKLRHCPWSPCRALPGQPCTVRVGRGRRRPMSGYHEARKETR